MAPKKILKEITNAFLEPTLDYNKLFHATRQLKDLFYQASSFDPDSEANRENLVTANGNALGPLWAAMCIDDFMRTKIFLMGINEAIKKKLQDNKGPVKILYAGCGPFATLVTPLTTCFTKEQLQITCIEINPLNTFYIDNIITAFEIEGYFKDIIITDASTYKFNAPNDFDIIITETMLASLRKEPQVAICLNLCPQADTSTILIPEEIIVSFALKNTSLSKTKLTEDQFESPITHIIPLLKLDKVTRTIDQLQLNKTIEVDKTISRQYNLAVLLTVIKIFGNHLLKYNQSGLTLPQTLTERFANSKTLAAFKYCYHLGENPGLRFEFKYE